MNIGFIGAGKMAQALARGFLNSGRSAEHLMASCPKVDEASLDQFKKLGIRTTDDNKQIACESDVIILSVKPMQIGRVASEIFDNFDREKHLLISLALGIKLRYIEQLLPSNSRVVRVMPNIPAVVGAGISAFSMGSACQDGDSKLVNDLFTTVGYSVEVPEYQMDPISGLSGSGPSYVFSMIEGLADGAVKMGLPRELSSKLAAMTLFGAAKMFLETGEHPAILKEAVQSPGGSTIFGMHELEKGGMRSLLINAVEAATERGRRMGEAAPPVPDGKSAQSDGK